MKKRTRWTLFVAFIAATASIAGIYLSMPVLFSISSGIVCFAAGFVVAIDRLYTIGNQGEAMNDATMTEVLEEIL